MITLGISLLKFRPASIWRLMLAPNMFSNDHKTLKYYGEMLQLSSWAKAGGISCSVGIVHSIQSKNSSWETLCTATTGTKRSKTSTNT